MTRYRQTAETDPYRSASGADGSSVLVWDGAPVTPDLTERLEHRLAMFQDRPSATLAQPLSVKHGADGLSLVMEDPPGIRLSRLLRMNRMRTDMLLGFAVQLTEAVEVMHNRRIAHGRLSPEAVFVHAERRELKLALHPECLVRPLEHPSDIEGRDVSEIVYCAPEQSGRTDTRPDTRADLYALGVIFYEMLTGAPPFESIDKLELLHMHLAVSAAGIARDKPGEEALARIVARLLEKAPGNRYQTAYGLLADLRLCRDAFLRDGSLPDFELGVQDQKATFAIPDKLYGRDAAQAQLRRAFEGVMAGGAGLVMVSGPSGSGKSALVETLRSLTCPGAEPVFLSGRYEEIHGLPYLGLRQALRNLILEKLARGEEAVARFRSALTEALGDNLPVVVAFLPDLQHIVGDIPADAAEDPMEINQRFQVSMQAFFETLSDAAAPLILFLDDLQWADMESIRLLEDIFLTATPSHFLIVGAFRDNEIPEAHPLRKLLATVSDAGITAAQIEVGPLSDADIRQLIIDTMHLDPKVDVDELAGVIAVKTQGNAFHVRRLLIALYREGAIRFDPRLGQWQWVMDAVTERMVEVDVANLMTERIQTLSPRAVAALRLAAAFGTRFAAASLRIVSDQSEKEILDDLGEAIHEGFVTEGQGDETGVFRFSHDIVRDAAYRSIPEDRRVELHYQIGAFLLRDIDTPQEDDRLFSAMDQIALGADLITDPEIGRRVTQGAIHGARRAKAVAAYGIGAGYLSLADSLPAGVSGIDWATDPEITQDLRTEAMEAAFMSGGFAEAEPHFQELIAHLASDAEKARIYQTLVTLFTSRSEYQKAIDFGVEGLKLLGVNLRGPPGPKIMTQLIGTRIDLRRHDVLDFSKLPDMDDPKAEQLIEMLMIVSTPAFLQNKDLFVLISLRMFRLTLRKGLTSAGLFSIQNYAIVIYLAFNSIDKAYEMGTNLFKLLEPRKIHPLVRGRFTYTYSVVLAWHFRRYDDLRALLRDGLVHSWTASDLEYVGYYYYSLLKYAWLMCKPLDRIADQLVEYDRYDRRLRHEVLSSITRIYHRAVARLTDPAETGLWTSDDREIEEQMTGEASVGSFCTTELLLTHVFGDWAMVGEISDKLRAQEGFATLGPEFVDYHLLLGLSLTRAGSRLSKRSPRKRRAQLRKHLAALKRLAEKYPTNHLYQYPLLLAEDRRMNGATGQARDLYDEALRKAEESGAWSYLGIACECAAALADQTGDSAASAEYLRRAHHAYAQWGAANKLRALEAERPDLVTPGPAAPPASADDALDVTSVIKASHLILEVTELDTLLKRLMQITLENAGADAGSLYLMHDDGHLHLAAEGRMQGAEPEISIQSDDGALDTLDPASYPRELVAQVAAARDAVILSDARSASRHARLAYVRARAPKSLMCLPVLGQHGLQAVLHLENSLSEGVFTIQRQEILSTLTSLAAISLSNARLYARQSKALELEKRATEELARVNRLKDEFLATTSHELRTPLNGIIGLAEALIEGAKGDLPAPARATLELIVSSGERLSHLVTDILDLSRLREGELSLQPRPLDLRALVDVVFCVMEPRAAQNGVDMINAVPGDAQALLADENRLQQILFNLVDNAIKFSPGGQVTVGLDLRRDRGHVTVTDTGIGIPLEAQTAIFESFRKLDASDESAFGGVGLGLAISKSLVEMHGGHIAVDSAEGRGTTISFDLPATDAPAQPTESKTVSRLMPGTRAQPGPKDDTTGGASDETGDGTRLFQPTAFSDVDTAQPVIRRRDADRTERQYRALLIDDDPINLEVLRNFMELEGFGIEMARDGPEGLRALEAGFEPDIVLLDVMMPGMSGYEVCRRIRATRPVAALPVVMLTAKNQVENLRAGFEVGATDYLAKPFSREELSARMHAHIELARLSTAYERFVPIEFLRFLERDSILDIELGNNVERQMTVMFSDIRSFTGFAEKSGPAETFAFLNDYFGRLGPLVHKNKGVVNQFLGDGIMSLFPGAPEEGVQAAVEMLRELRRFNADRETRGQPSITTGIGLHTGDLIMGIMGDKNRMSGNVVSDAVNLAARLEGLTARYGVGIAVSEEVIAALPDPGVYPHRQLDVVRVAGRDKPVVVYEIFAADPPDSARHKAETRPAFEAALAALRTGHFASAEAGFAEIAAAAPRDKAARTLAERARHLARSDLPEGWSGIEMLEK
ncbi:AAA family ATPase [Aquicoccus sp. SU-CL01552]|uniref:ATP-binding protein n=1 Tax=Aquicoccus sp. SU-CL01552 TaxID=3127656 RepID=UPI00310493F9